ncbi:hypothetical protein LEMLEM_LOCUS11521 [Lemmus lemmus]
MLRPQVHISTSRDLRCTSPHPASPMLRPQVHISTSGFSNAESSGAHLHIQLLQC